MAITLDSLALPEDLTWTDEFDWTPVAIAQSYAVDGTQILETGVRQKGRPITLAGNEASGWISRADLLTLQGMAQTPGVCTLTLHDGRSFQVEFRHADKPIEAKPLVSLSQPGPTDYYTLILRLMEV